jgi:hypothetical protein
MLVSVRAANDRRSSGSGSGDGEIIRLTLSLRSSVDGSSKCSGGNVSSDDPSHRQRRCARTGNDETVEIDPELKNEISGGKLINLNLI